MNTTETLKNEYDRSGFVLVRGLFDRKSISSIRTSVDSALGGSIAPTGVKVFDAAVTPPDLLSICTAGRLAEKVHALLGEEVEFLSLKPVLKTGVIRTPSPWHQDWPYWKGSHKLSVWIALDRATEENGCLRIVKGSHVEPWDHASVNAADGFTNRLEDREIVERYGEEGIDSVPMEAGDALFFHDLLLHSSHPNPSGRDRWSLIPTYRDASIPDDHALTELWHSPVRM